MQCIHQSFVGLDYGSRYLGSVDYDLIGLTYTLFDNGVTEAVMKAMPNSTFSPRKAIMTASFDTRILIDKPSAFRVEVSPKYAHSSRF